MQPKEVIVENVVKVLEEPKMKKPISKQLVVLEKLYLVDFKASAREIFINCLDKMGDLFEEVKKD